MSDKTILIEGLINTNGIDRGGIFELPEDRARALISKGFARLHREKPPAPSSEQFSGAGARPKNQNQNPRRKPNSKGNKNGSKSNTPEDGVKAEASVGTSDPASDITEDGTAVGPVNSPDGVQPDEKGSSPAEGSEVASNE